MAKLKITETVLRDAHQSLLATRMSMDDMRLYFQRSTRSVFILLSVGAVLHLTHVSDS